MKHAVASVVSPRPYFFRRQASSAYHTLFAATIPSVPDLSSYQEFVNVDSLEQLRRVFNAQRLLLLGLNTQPDPAQGKRVFELRFLWDGQRLTVAFLGKGAASSQGEADKIALALWEDVTKLFPAGYYRGGIQPALDRDQFNALYAPFDLHNAEVVALEKPVEVQRLLRSQQAYAVVHPYKWGISTMAGLCKTLQRQARPHIVSIALEPCTLTEEERTALNSLAGALRKAGEGRDKSRRMGMMSTLAAGANQVSNRDQLGQAGQENFLPDPMAELAADIYAGYLARLDRPLVIRPYIVAEDAVDPSVVGAWQAEIVGYIPTPGDPTEEAPLPHIPQEWRLRDNALRQARDNLQLLETTFLPGGVSEQMQAIEGRLGSSCHELARLPGLVDIHEASCAFRLPALLHRDEIGLPVHSGAFVALAQSALNEPVLRLGVRDDGKTHHVHLHDLTKHTLVVGTTGSGKTTTCLHLLAELSRYQIPFLVIEPVNAEHNDYRSLLRLPSLQDTLQIFTLGDEAVAPFRLNPFEIQPGVTVNEHISAMLTAFKAAIPMWEPLPRLFLKALNRTYYQHGWSAFRKPGGNADEPAFPTLYDFYRQLQQVVDHEIEHAGEVRSNIEGASKLRIEALLEGSCGRILSARQSLPIETWLERPTILELRHIGDDEDKALMIAFILMAVNEYLDKGRERLAKGQLQHVTLIEEAHRLLANTAAETNSEQSNTKGQAAQAFARALAENRKYGEGIVIAEQLPTKLVPDVIGNTGLKIMHRLTSSDDREVMGRAMKFDEFQQEHVVTLRTGQAAVYGLDLDEPVLVQAPDFWQEWEQRQIAVETQPVSDEEVATVMASYRHQFAALYVPFIGCKLCPHRCVARDHGEALLFDKSLNLTERFHECVHGLDENDSNEHVLMTLVNFCNDAVDGFIPVPLVGNDHKAAAYCVFLHLKDASGLFPDRDNLIWEENFRLVQEAVHLNDEGENRDVSF